jgi:hypothetical protein
MGHIARTFQLASCNILSVGHLVRPPIFSRIWEANPATRLRGWLRMGKDLPGRNEGGQAMWRRDRFRRGT